MSGNPLLFYNDSAMVDIIQNHLEELLELCRQYHVLKLYVFGSATTERFRPGESDIDLLVTFEPSLTPHEHRMAYFGFIDAAKSLFATEIDLIEEPCIRNPYFREELDETRVKLYAA